MVLHLDEGGRDLEVRIRRGDDGLLIKGGGGGGNSGSESVVCGAY